MEQCQALRCRQSDPWSNPFGVTLDLWFSEWRGFAERLVSGIVIAAISIAALTAFAVWEEWLNLILGIWVLVSPWVLGFAGTTAMQVHIVIGVIVAVLAALEIWLLYQRPPRRTAAG
jgi:SPW repeat